ncbi:hypothetical protein [Sphingomonas sp. Leaf4]|uniref:hypothetical protein n=1 Tax=Sphingomonas sp. Leaf4 TaxID=2876553 RepID=UPI001E6277D2|nr:hypothetical protein [Sphingomonas sp. Leaf4]
MDGTNNRISATSAAMPDARRPWQTPEVITSDASGAGAQVAFGSDGSTPVYGPYGS